MIMKRILVLVFTVGLSVLLSSCASHEHAQRQAGAPDYYVGNTEVFTAWPMRFNDEGTDFTVFEPQVDSWDGHKITGRCALAVQGPYAPEASYGTFAFSGITLVDKSEHTATLADFKITRADFPSARDQTQNYVTALTQRFSTQSPPLALDSLETAMKAPPPPRVDHLDNSPPRVIVATRPAVLVPINGAPAWRAVPGTDLQRVINTRMLVLKDSAGHIYLHLYDGYVQSSSLDGPWTVVAQPPAEFAVAEKAATESGQVDLMTGVSDSSGKKPLSLKASALPDIFVATTPAELIQFQGEPEYAPIPGTELIYASNTSGNVFKSLADQQNYILLSGRWYSAPSLKGPWQFLPGDKLPHDFAAIPDSSPKENVKASVPGTPQASEALVANNIPQSTAVARTKQMVPPQIDGPVQLAPIQGTALQYVVNSGTPIIEVNPQSWYACQDGVWYQATSVSGPWVVAVSVPPVIYTIPVDCPLHYVTYVQIYGSTPDTVYEGYTPGYMGTEVADDGTVVYGTGYDYNPWVGDVWYGPPVTWGWGFYDCWSPWWGWGFGPGFGWGWGWGWGPYPYWGGFCRHDWDHDRWHDHGGWHQGAWAHTSANIYHRGTAAAEPFAGTRGGFGHSYNSRTGWIQSGQHASVQNVGGAAWQRNTAFRNGFSSHAYGGLNWNRANPGGGRWSYPSGRGWNGYNLAPRGYAMPGGPEVHGGVPHAEGGFHGGGAYRGGGGGGGGGGHGGGGGRR